MAQQGEPAPGEPGAVGKLPDHVRVAFVGTGVMAEAMIAGTLGKGIIAPAQVVASHPREDRRRPLSERFGIATVAANEDAVRGADLILLTIKPQVLDAVMKQLRDALQPGQVVISILAGANFGVLRHGLDHAELVRVMPNTPAQIGEGMSVWCCTPEIGSEK